MRSIVIRALVLTLGAGAGIATAQPVISTAGIVNAASGLRAGLPGSAIAQGGLFVMYGTGLGPAELVQATYPLRKTLAGTSISITVNGATVDALMVYTSATQVAALLPSSTLAGKGTISLTSNGSSSVPARILVAPASFGIFTLSQSGGGPAVVQNFESPTSVPVNTMIRPASAGQVVILYGTGLGAVEYDETGPPQSKDLGGDFAVYVGGKAANVLYHGRSSCCAGLDQINFVVPAGVESCAAPVAVVVAGVTSNMPTMAIAAAGAPTCSDPVGFSTSDLMAFQAKGKATFGELYFESAWLNQLGYGESGSGNFYEATLDQLLTSGAANWVGTPGACFSSLVGSRAGLKAVNVGTALTFTGPSKASTLNFSTSGLYGFWSAFPTAPDVIKEGGATLDNGIGSTSVGTFKTNFTIGKAPVWTNQGTIGTVDRSKALTITWTDGDPNETMIIIANTTGGSIDSDFPGSSSVFSCYARASDGQFTIPQWVVSKLPPTINGTFGTLRVGSVLMSPRITAPGLDIGYFELKRDSQLQPFTVK